MRIKTQKALTAVPAKISTDPDILAGYLEDSARTPGGWARDLVRPENEAQICRFLNDSFQSGAPVLPVGAQSSLTGGATPFGDRVLSTEKIDRIKCVNKTSEQTGTVVCEPGITVLDLQKEVHKEGLFYPPAPTYDLACVGGTIATNASGAAAFKYGNDP